MGMDTSYIKIEFESKEFTPLGKGYVKVSNFTISSGIKNRI
jgi:hypothetical protein